MYNCSDFFTPRNVVNRDPTRPLFFGNWIASWNCIEIENCLCYISRGSVKLNNFHTNSCDFTFAMLLHYWRWQLARSRFLCNWYNFPQARGLNYRKFKMRNNTCWSVKISRFKRSYYCRTYRCTVFENYRKSLIQHYERS